MNLEVTQDELNVIAAGIGKLPFEVAAPVFQKLQSQVQAQAPSNGAPQDPAPAAEPTEAPAA